MVIIWHLWRSQPTSRLKRHSYIHVQRTEVRSTKATKVNDYPMKIKSIPIRLLFILNLVLFISPVLATDISGKVIAFSCSGCHGTDGQLAKPGLPRLKSQPAEKLERALLDFKYDKKYSSIMGRISKGYSDTELKAVARYFSKL